MKRCSGSRRSAKSSGRTSTCLGDGAELNQSLEHAGRVADFLEFAELLCLDARTREESCGGHFREEYQTEDGEALRNDEQFSFVVGLGVSRSRQATPAAQGVACLRRSQDGAAELQVASPERGVGELKLKKKLRLPSPQRGRGAGGEGTAALLPDACVFPSSKHPRR